MTNENKKTNGNIDTTPVDVSRIQVGQVYKNYKVLCEYFGEIPKSGSSKLAHVKNWERHFSFKKEGFKLIITEIYDTPRKVIDFREKGGNAFKTPLIETSPILASEWLEDRNNMKIPEALTRRSDDNYWWKCAICSKDIYTSAIKRLSRCLGNSEEFITCPYCSLSKHAKKVYDFLMTHNIEFTQEHMFSDLVGMGNRRLRFDFAVYDESKNLISLIEYDGGYHDEHLNPDKENFDTTRLHDGLKDKYCEDNNIHLLRIHHTETDIYKQLIYNHFNQIGNPSLPSYKNLQVDTSTLEKWQNEVSIAQSKIKELEQFVSALQGKLEVWS